MSQTTRSAVLPNPYDVIVVGGGPAGMMAAGRAAERGLNVLLIEKNESLGKKLLITGGGRCNVTNATFELRSLLPRYREAEPFLYSAFTQHDVKASLEFFNSRSMQTKEENERRVFPVSDSAQSVWNVLVENMKKHNVTVLSNCPVVDFEVTDENISAVVTKKGRFAAQSFILATGGTSRPETGSTGDGFVWLKKLGHKVHDPIPSLVPLTSPDTWVHEHHGVTLPDLALSIFNNGERESKKVRGKVLFTHVGLTGPTILNMSKDIVDLLGYGKVEISLDLLPDHDTSTLNTALQDLFKKHHTKKIKNALAELIPNAVVERVLQVSNIIQDTACNSITRDQRILLMHTLKDLRVNINGLLEEKAVVSSGGIDLTEVDFATMRSRKYPNLYIVGDVLNINRPSGGYSLQLCWTTGWVAGNSVDKK